MITPTNKMLLSDVTETLSHVRSTTQMVGRNDVRRPFLGLTRRRLLPTGVASQVLSTKYSYSQTLKEPRSLRLLPSIIIFGLLVGVAQTSSNKDSTTNPTNLRMQRASMQMHTCAYDRAHRRRLPSQTEFFSTEGRGGRNSISKRPLRRYASAPTPKTERRPVRVRFAPSPTGDLHMGSGFIALFNWMYAKKHGGTFVLRIEDTSVRRNKKGSVQSITDGLKWLGLDWDEGPGVDGKSPRTLPKCEPYFQSQRGKVYEEYKNRLLKADRAYLKRTEEGEEVWFKASGKPQTYEDMIKGQITQMGKDDFILFRADGSVKFHLANVVDDITMGITHVLRGSDKVNDGDMGKHLDLMKACGDPFIPKYGHLPLIMKPDGSGKLSKRDGGCVLIHDYQKQKFPPQAVKNYLYLMGLPQDGGEVKTLDQMLRDFDFKRINKENPLHDEKLLERIKEQWLARIDEQTPKIN